MRSRIFALLCASTLGITTLLLAGCPATGDDVRPPRTGLVFPSGLAVSADESVLFVANANSELRFDSGSVLAIDLQAIDDAIADWLDSGRMTVPDGCIRDALVPTLLQCDESLAIDPSGGVRIGNFASEIGVQQVGPDHMRVVVAVRGDPSVTWIDYRTTGASAGQLKCAGSDDFPLCDRDNRLISLRNDPDLLSLIGEPFGVHVGTSDGNDYALVTHLSLANVTLVNLPRDNGAEEAGAPVLVDSLPGLFNGDPTTGVRSAVGVASRPSATGHALFYVTSRSEERVQILSVERTDRGPILLPVQSFLLNGVSPSDDSRGITFNDDGSRAYIVNRSPAVLHVIDTSDGPDGFPRNQPVGFAELCRDASNVAATRIPGRGERVYAACFPGGQVWTFDPEAGGDPIAITDVGRGPHAVALARGRNRLYVANVLEDTLAVIDLTPGAATENRMVMRLGVPRQVED